MNRNRLLIHLPISIMPMLHETIRTAAPTFTSLIIVTKRKTDKLFAEFSPTTDLLLHVDTKAHNETYHRRWIAPSKSVALATDRKKVVEGVSSPEVMRHYVICLPTLSEATAANVTRPCRLFAY